MDDLARINTFIKVVEAGSFSAAARDVSSISSVARQVKSLEDELGIRLLNRNTRNLSLTDAGRRFYERVTAISTELTSLKSEVRSLQEDVKGVLRVSLRISAGTTVVVPALPRFLARYPEISLDITLTDERRDLIANNIDVAIWLGDLPNSEIVARRLSPSRRVVCGSPEYFSRRGVPQVPHDLVKHNCLIFAAPSYGNRWTFQHGEVLDEVAVNGSVRSENGLVLMDAALAGIGVILVNEWMVRSCIASGRLQRVLGEYTVSPRAGDADLYAVYVSSRGVSRKIKAFVEFLVEIFAQPEKTPAHADLRGRAGAPAVMSPES